VIIGYGCNPLTLCDYVDAITKENFIAFKNVLCVNNLKQNVISIILFTDDNKDYYPFRGKKWNTVGADKYLLNTLCVAPHRQKGTTEDHVFTYLNPPNANFERVHSLIDQFAILRYVRIR